jgi:hypothetical protein
MHASMRSGLFVRAKVPVGVVVAPIIPGLTDREIPKILTPPQKRARNLELHDCSPSVAGGRRLMAGLSDMPHSFGQLPNYHARQHEWVCEFVRERPSRHKLS